MRKMETKKKRKFHFGVDTWVPSFFLQHASFGKIRFKKMCRIQLIKGDTYLTLEKMVIHEKMMQLFRRLIYNNLT